jgi:hypothetical protein
LSCDVLEPKLANHSPIRGILQEVRMRAYTHLNKLTGKMHFACQA